MAKIAHRNRRRQRFRLNHAGAQVLSCAAIATFVSMAIIGLMRRGRV